MNKTKLITTIYKSFKNVKLEDGIGLWEGQGLDDYLSVEECKKLREKDEKEDWSKISVLDLYKCSSSLSFFDTKGMRFYLPQFMLFHIDVFEKEEEKLYQEEKIGNYFCPDIFSTLSYEMSSEYSQYQFSLLNKQQIQCVIDFLHYILEERKAEYKLYERTYSLEEDIKDYKDVIVFWKNKLQ